MTSFGIVVLVGAALALYMCTPQGDEQGMAPGRAVVTGFASAAGTFVLMLAVTLAVTVTGIGDAAKQLRAKGKVSTPSWMHATVSIRRAMVYVMYGCLGFALGGTVAGTLELFRGN